MATSYQNKRILVVGGLDPTGHAGLLRDKWVCEKLHSRAESLITALAIQSDERYLETVPVGEKYLQKKMQVKDPGDYAAIKIGMLANAGIVDYTVKLIKKYKKQNPDIRIVWDPVFYSTSGGMLLDRKGQKLAIKKILPLCDLVTPNAYELVHFLPEYNQEIMDPSQAVLVFWKKFRRSIYLKGGHLRQKARDFLLMNGMLKIYDGKTTYKKNVRGTGCALATAISCYLTQGSSLEKACEQGKMFISRVYRRLP